MTRMWCVPPEILCDDHLRGEHAEHHQLVGTILNHPYGEAIAAGHAEKGNIDTSRLEERHDELAEEMERRGFNHESPLEYDGPAFGIGAIDVDHNRSDLLNRCDECEDRAAKRY
ncbi:pyrimidine dimer DNA glycosylase/endonuclease V [Halocatena salina]|uniref:Pyrimidine dimer DNA glycosylase/endonuclease V n=1 Tax=Halocatena salina TaxID=2934340 RepID=A0A8U0A4R8_9EURY|nr:pyrimidine dimer DNA glycosylase/endonuclease V [Halocatena salina]UPM44211.1 pyrimidine dimer DNA glycosylase/endonuclease V [Halocatena salina]